MKVTANQAISDAVLETLEQRQLMSAVSFDAGVLTLQGLDNSTNQLAVHLTNDDTKVQAVVNGESFRFRLGSVKTVKVIGGRKADSISVDSRLKIGVLVEANAGNDTVMTGAGNDSVFAGAGNDAVYTGLGKDIISGQAGNDTLNGGDGEDSIRGGNGRVVLRGESGSDLLVAGNGHGRLLGGTGNDLLIAGPASRLNGEAGTDTRVRLTTDGAIASSSHDAVPVTITPVATVTGDAPAVTPTGTAVSVKSFTLIDASTGKPVAGYVDINDGDTLDLTKLPAKLNIRANLSQGSGTVQFDFNGKTNFNIETSAPYALGGDKGTTFNTLALPVGSNTLKAGIVKDGVTSGTKSITFRVIKSAVVVTPTTPTTPTVPTTPATDATAPKAKITAITTAITAGESIHVHALDTKLTNGDFHQAQYVWDFGDGNVAFSKLRGFNVAHTYDKSGKFTITLTVTDAKGKVGTTKLEVNVAAASRKSIYVSTAGSDTNSGLTANSPLKTVAKAFALMTDNTQVLLKRGDTFGITEGLMIKANNSVLGAYGIGDRPTIKWTGVRERVTMLGFAGDVKDAAVQDITFDTKFNQDTNQTNMPFAIRPAGTNITIRRNEFLNVGYAINNNLKPTGVLIQGNIAPSKVGVRDYFCWAAGTDLVILDNTVANTTREHVIRISGINRILVSNNDLTSLDRRANGDPYDAAKGAIVVQQGKFAYVAGNEIHGPFGPGPLGDADGLQSKTNRFEYSVFENNEAFDTFTVNHGAEHVSVRNNVFHDDGKVAIRVEAYSEAYERGVEDLIIDNNTAINNEANGSFLVLNGPAKGLVMTDNVYVAPHLAPGAYGTAAVRVIDNDLHSFTKISGNVWPLATNALTYAAGGINYIGASMTSAGYQTAAEWNALPQVGDDVLNNVTLASSYSINISGAVLGAQLAA